MFFYQHWHCQKVTSRCSPFQTCHIACWLFGNVATWQLHNPPASPGATDLMTYSCSWQGRGCLQLQNLSSRSGSGSTEETIKKGWSMDNDVLTPMHEGCGVDSLLLALVGRLSDWCFLCLVGWTGWFLPLDCLFGYFVGWVGWSMPRQLCPGILELCTSRGWSSAFGFWWRPGGELLRYSPPPPPLSSFFSPGSTFWNVNINLVLIRSKWRHYHHFDHHHRHHHQT